MLNLVYIWRIITLPILLIWVIILVIMKIVINICGWGFEAKLIYK